MDQIKNVYKELSPRALQKRGFAALNFMGRKRPFLFALLLSSVASAQFFGSRTPGVPCPAGLPSGSFCVAGRMISGYGFAGVRTLSGCPIFPATSIFHSDLSQAPVDEYATQQMIGLRKAVTNASWAAGTATLTVPDTEGLTLGTKIFVSLINGGGTSSGPSGFNTGFGCNTTSCISAGGSYDTRVTITALTSTTLSYALASDPGAYSSGGSISTGPYGMVRLSTTPSMGLNTALSTDTAYSLSCNGCGNSGENVPFADFVYLNSDNVPYVLNNSMHLENGTIGTGPYFPNSDAHAFVLLTDVCKLQEIYGVQSSGPPFHAMNGVEWDLRSNQMRSGKYFCPDCTAGFDGPDAAGLPIYPLTLTHAQIYGSDAIDTPVRITMRVSNQGWRWPAIHRASRNTNSFTAPMGTWFRLNASFDVSGYPDGTGGTPNIQKVLNALKKHGAILADNGLSGLLTLSSEFSAQEDSDIVTQLHTVYMDQFQVLNVQPLQVNAHTYEAAPFTPVTQAPLVLVTLASSPSGRTVNYDQGSCVTPCQLIWRSGDSHTINAPTQTVGTLQYSFSSWSDAGSQSHSVAPTTHKTYLATFTSAYVAPSDPTFSPAAGGIVSGSSVTMSTTPSGCDSKIYWNTTGSPTTSDTNSTSATVTPPQTVYAKVIGCGLTVGPDSGVASAAYTPVYSDTFSGTGALGANWTNVPSMAIGGGTMVKNSGVAQPSANFTAASAIYTAASIPRNQFSQATITTVASGATDRVCILMDSSGNGYCAGTTGSAASINKFTAGVSTFLKSCPAIAAGQVMKFASDSSGNLTLWADGVQTCAQTDTTWTSGYPGISVRADSTTAVNGQLANWSGGQS